MTEKREEVLEELSKEIVIINLVIETPKGPPPLMRYRDYFFRLRHKMTCDEKWNFLMISPRRYLVAKWALRQSAT